MAESQIGTFSITFAKVLRGVMTENDVKVRDVADHMGRSHGFISERTGGKRPVDTDILDAVAQLIGISPRELVTRIAARMEPAPAPGVVMSGHGSLELGAGPARPDIFMSDGTVLEVKSYTGSGAVGAGFMVTPTELAMIRREAQLATTSEQVEEVVEAWIESFGDRQISDPVVRSGTFLVTRAKRYPVEEPVAGARTSDVRFDLATERANRHAELTKALAEANRKIQTYSSFEDSAEAARDEDREKRRMD